jgi:hypothetical protein
MITGKTIDCKHNYTNSEDLKQFKIITFNDLFFPK